MTTHTHHADVPNPLGDEQPLLSRVLDMLFSFVGVLTPDGRLIEANRAPLEIANLKREDVIGKKFWRCPWWSYNRRTQLQLCRAIRRARQGETVRYTAQIRAADEQLIWIDFQLAPLYDGEGRLQYLVPSGTDLSERMAVEESARRTEATFKRTFENALVGMAHVGLNGGFLRSNSRMSEIVGYSQDDLATLTFHDITHPDDLDEAVRKFDTLKRGESEGYQIEKRYIREDGVTVWVHLSMSLVRDEEGEPSHFIKIIDDISIRKSTEHALRESELRLRLANEASGLGTYDFSPQSGLLLWDERLREIWGLSKNEPATYEKFITGLHPDDVDKTNDAIARALDPDGDGIYNAEYRVINRLDGRTRWINALGRTFFEDGVAVRLIGTVKDITEQRESEQRLRESEARLRMILDATNVGLWDLDMRSGDASRTRRHDEIFGYSEQLPEWSFDTFVNRHVHPDDRDRIEQVFRRARESGGEIEFECRIIRVDGEERWIWVSGTSHLNGQTQKHRFAGVVMDITSRKNAEQQVRTVMAELNHRVKNTIAVIQAIVRQTLRRSPTLDVFRESFERRIQSIASAHSLLTESNWAGAMIEDIVLCELEPLSASPFQYNIEGQPQRLRPKVALALHMLMHEMATNASKYGALRTPGGRIDIRWEVDGERVLRFTWQEHSDSDLEEHGRAGYGSELIRQVIDYELGGSMICEYKADGIYYEFSFPLRQVRRQYKSNDDSPERTKSPSRASVLVVEDNLTLAMSVCEELREAGFRVIGPAADEAEASRLFEAFRPDAALLDVDLDGEKSYELTRRVTSAGVPIALLTGYTPSDLPADLRDVPLIRKPADPETIVEFLRKAVPTGG